MSLLADGAFLTASSHQWTPRVDGSRQFDLTETCHLHRYTPDQARHCLAGQHVNMIGDSVTRFQFLSFAYMIHHAHYPPRFGYDRTHKKCAHFNHDQQPTCSTPTNPGITRNFEFQGDLGLDFIKPLVEVRLLEREMSLKARWNAIVLVIE